MAFAVGEEEAASRFLQLAMETYDALTAKGSPHDGPLISIVVEGGDLLEGMGLAT